MTIVYYYFIPDSENNKNAEQIIENAKKGNEFQLVRVPLDEGSALLKEWGDQAPVLKIGPYTLRWPFTTQEIVISIGAHQDRRNHIDTVNGEGNKVKRHPIPHFGWTDKFALWLTKHYLLVLNFFFAAFVGLPFLAPVFMHANLTTPANIIYSIYRPLCHQIAFRSWFLFGEQSFYPRNLAGIDGVITYEQALGIPVLDVFSPDFEYLVNQAVLFTGDETMGYKVALCQRDVAIYGSFLLFGFLFLAVKRKLPQIPFWVWVVVGVIPIGIDGTSQLPRSLPFLTFLPGRESNPLFRTVTGILFGFLTAWYLYPLLEETMQNAKEVLLHKKALYSLGPLTEDIQ